jgi:hypothetical protein
MPSLRTTRCLSCYGPSKLTRVSPAHDIYVIGINVLLSGLPQGAFQSGNKKASVERQKWFQRQDPSLNTGLILEQFRSVCVVIRNPARHQTPEWLPLPGTKFTSSQRPCPYSTPQWLQTQNNTRYIPSLPLHGARVSLAFAGTPSCSFLGMVGIVQHAGVVQPEPRLSSLEPKPRDAIEPPRCAALAHHVAQWLGRAEPLPHLLPL